jgi:hypothetical protein
MAIKLATARCRLMLKFLAWLYLLPTFAIVSCASWGLYQERAKDAVSVLGLALVMGLFWPGVFAQYRINSCEFVGDRVWFGWRILAIAFFPGAKIEDRSWPNR